LSKGLRPKATSCSFISFSVIAYPSATPAASAAEGLRVVPSAARAPRVMAPRRSSCMVTAVEAEEERETVADEVWRVGRAERGREAKASADPMRHAPARAAQVMSFGIFFFSLECRKSQDASFHHRSNSFR
jgi:hypothetical protein